MISLYSSLAQEKPALPQGEAFFWGKEPVVETSATRAEINLNGLWLFQPAQGDKKPAAAWGAIRVPGSWEMQSEWGNTVMPGLVGKSPKWDGVTFIDHPVKPNQVARSYVLNLANAWYERELSIPAAWNGRKIVIDFERVSTDATVYLNGQEAGKLHWPGGKLDLTALVKPGTTYKLQVLVTAVGSEKELLVAMREDYADKGNSGLRQRGIIGDVMLYAMPTGPVLQPIAVRCSVAKKEISLLLRTENLKAPVTGKAVATIKTWPEGKEVKKLEAPVSLDPTKETTLTWPWADAKLWEIGEPNLYTVAVKIEAPGFNDERSERFGFREVRTEGRKIFLNGKEFRARTSHADADTIGGMKEVAYNTIERSLNYGYNLLEIWPNDNFRRGFADWRPNYAKWADEKGILIFMPVVRTDDIFDWKKPIPEDKMAIWLAANKTHIERVWNSPSVLAYLFFGNEFMTADDQSPYRLGNRAALMQSQQRDVTAAAALLEKIRLLDPTRMFGSHSGAAMGDFQTVNHYLGLNPLQEREETPAIWAASGDMPYGAVEFCTPFSADLHRARRSWNTSSEALATEFMVVQLGSKAYEAEEDVYRKLVVDRFNLATGSYTGWPGGLEQGQVGYGDYPPYQDFQSEQFLRVWRSWRTYGVNLGMIQWEKVLEDNSKAEKELPPFEPGRRGVYFSTVPGSWVGSGSIVTKTLKPYQRAYYDGIQPIVAYIGGPAQDGGWVAKDHHFSSGAQAQQSIVIVNDSRQEQPYKVNWTLTTTGQEKPLTGELTGQVLVGESKIIPLTFTAPTVMTKTDASLSMVAQVTAAPDTITLNDTKKLRFYPASPAVSKLKIQAFDPEGKTTKLLQSLGYTITPWLTGAPTGADLVVIGRKAMNDPKFPNLALRDYLNGGGKVVLFSQDPNLLRERGGLRIHQWIGRQFWPLATQLKHPLLAGLDAEDLRDWTGSSTLIPPHNETDLVASAKRLSYPTYGYRVGGRGGVSSSIWEKPHHSAWTPLLEGEFDLAYSPLMELSYGKGLLVLNSMDVEDRADPMASDLTRRVVEYTATAKPTPRRKVFYTGDDEGAALLKSMTIIAEKSMGAPATGSLWVIGSGADVSDSALESALKAGTHVMIIGGHSKLPLGLTTKKTIFGRGPETLPTWPELAGVSLSEVRLRADIELSLIQPVEGLELAAKGLIGRKVVGAGSLIAFQGNPNSLDAGKKNYLRISEWRWHRALSQILGNLGASFESDTNFFDLKINTFLPIDLAGQWKVLLETSMPASEDMNKPSLDGTPLDLAKTKADYNDSSWDSIRLPAMNKLGTIDLEKIDGSLWLRRKITIPAAWKGMGNLRLVLPTLDDHDLTFLNGVKIGGVGKENTTAWNTPRIYSIPAYVVKPGQDNVIAIRLFDQFGGGGMGGGDTPLTVRIELVKNPEISSFYLPGFSMDRQDGDDPARYTRW